VASSLRLVLGHCRRRHILDLRGARLAGAARLWPGWVNLKLWFRSGPRWPASRGQDTPQGAVRYARWVTVRDMIAALQRLPRDAEVLAMEAGCDQYCEIELDDVELQRDRVYLHVGIRRETPPPR
jgi:hypothetical protein